ncbi:hypothetical protein AB0F17_60545 [Nonomuraea sp. NPDC026600]|uniref:hypothetical protein n=1 Tax=Nonomuraea sp. NPDC026600 TaxID=3155363 RepID=UPI0033E78E66
MSFQIVLYGLRCSLCGAEDELRQDLMRALVECRACGHRAMIGDVNACDDEPAEIFGMELIEGYGDAFDPENADAENTELDTGFGAERGIG